jgi:hypothetical protein
MAVNRVFDPVAEATSAFQLVIKNWMLAVPQLIVGCVVVALALVLGLGSIMAAGGIAALMNSSNSGSGLAALSGLFGTIWIIALVGCILGLIAYAATVAAADDAWSGRPVNIGAAIGKGIACLFQLIIFGLIVAIPSVLLGITVIVPLAIAVLMMYGLPAIVISGQSGIGAITESYNLVTKNFGPSLIAILAVIVAYIAGFVINMVLGIIPIVGQIIGLVVGALIFAYACAVIVRFYSLLRSGAIVAAAPASPVPPAPPTAS